MTTWNAADFSSEITISNANLTATRNNTAAAWRAGRGVSSYTVGTVTKRYFEIKADAFGGVNTNGLIAGVAKAAATLNGYIGSDVNGYGIQAGNTTQRNFYCASVNTFTTAIPAIAAGERLMVAVDFATGKIWFGTKGSWSGDPVAGTGNAGTLSAGTYYPAISLNEYQTAADLYATETGLSYAIPNGFQAWTATPKYARIKMVNRSNVARANMAGLKWAFFDQTAPGSLSTPTAQGTAGSTDVDGNLALQLNGSLLAAGSIGFLVVTNTDGTEADSIAFAAPVRVVT